MAAIQVEWDALSSQFSTVAEQAGNTTLKLSLALQSASGGYLIQTDLSAAFRLTQVRVPLDEGECANRGYRHGSRGLSSTLAVRVRARGRVGSASLGQGDRAACAGPGKGDRTPKFKSPVPFWLGFLRLVKKKPRGW